MPLQSLRLGLSLKGHSRDSDREVDEYSGGL